MKIKLWLLLILILLSTSVQAQDLTVRVATYSLLSFDAEDGDRIEYFQTVLAEIDPQILICQDLDDEAGAVFFAEQMFDAEIWSAAEFIDCDGQSDNICYFRSDLFEMGEVVAIPTDLRDLNIYPLRYLADDNTPTLYLATSYLKGSTGGANEEQRRGEVEQLMNYLVEQELTAEHVLFGGNMNLYDDGEPAYQLLLENDLFTDPTGEPGNWHDAEEFAHLHTQSTRTAQFGGGASGGLDDRFDFIFTSQALANEEGWSYVPDSYTTFGNDGQHLNMSITDEGNDAVAEAVAEALYQASDHLPVYLDVQLHLGPAQVNIVLNEGWNMISTPIPPDDPDMRVVLTDLVERENMTLIKDHYGNFYVPEYNFSNLPDWQVLSGYVIRVAAEDQLSFIGEAVDVETEIPLEVGWSIISYLPDADLPVEVATSNLDPQVLYMIKNNRGRFYFPRVGFSNMDLLERGQGYQVAVTEPVNFVWNSGAGNQLNELLVSHEEIPEPVHFRPVAPTDRNQSVLVESATLTRLEAGSEIGAFTATGLCVGAGVVNRTGQAGLAIWGDDPTTEAMDGALPGQELSFYSWVDEQLRKLEFVTDDPGYEADGLAQLSVLSTATPESFRIFEPYPNPFNSMVQLSFSISDAGRYELTIFDSQGRFIEHLINRELRAGIQTQAFEANDLTAGIYFARLSSSTQNQTVKLLLIK